MASCGFVRSWLESRHGLVLLQQNGGIKECSQPIKIGLADVIVHVVVTLGTSDLQTEEDRSNGRRDFIHQNMFAFFLRINVRHVRT